MFLLLTNTFWSNILFYASEEGDEYIIFSFLNVIILYIVYS